MKVAAIAIILLTVAIPLGALRPQSPLVGYVLDSLRTGGPVASAEVVLLPNGARALTDARGRFAFPAGLTRVERIVHWGAWLDSLGLPPLEIVVDQDVSTEYILATPSPATYVRSRCGVDLGEDDGILIGEVRDLPGSPQADVVVIARWTETRLGRGTLEERPIATVDTTSASGVYTLCGVPRDAVVSVRALGAHGNGARSGVRSARISDVVDRLDLVVGQDYDRAIVGGRVSAADRGAIANARVSLRGDSAVATLTDSLGEFRLTMPLRSGELEVRAVGYEPRSIPVDLADLRGERREVRLDPVPPELERVVVTADPFAHERRGFEDRRRGAAGYFLTEDELSGFPDVSANVIANQIPRMRAVGRVLKLRRGSEFCSPRFFRDGIDEGTLEGVRTPEQVDLLQRAKRIEVYTANQAPPRYNDNDGCGVVVVWTR